MSRLGFDFDNTIVSYDSLFHKVAREGGWIPGTFPPSKVLVRDHLRKIGKEDVFTEMQGLVYGARMAEAEAFRGVHDFLCWAREGGLELFIVSHRTRYPFLGPKYDLHAAARKWIEKSLRDEHGPFVKPANVFFELTQEEKCGRLGRLGCTWFVDDLPEFLTAPGFPKNVEPVLFDPDGHHSESPFVSIRSWADLKCLIASKWQRCR